MNRRLSLTIILVLGLALLTFLNLVGDWGRLSGGMSNLGVFFRESLWPPDWSVLEAQSYPVCDARLEFTCSVAWLGMVETIKIAFVATVIGFVVALPLSVMAASNLSPIEIAVPTRILLAGMRSLPSIIWAVLFMIIFEPWFSSPSRLPAGTRQSSKYRVAVSEHHQPIFRSSGVRVKPGVSRSITSREMPLWPASPVRTATV